ncbi:MAG: hypothetical protein VX420_02920 [SAR324 cluster bacterium]|nr:hypothetical protein [SAR324 cluster bacterium]
MHELKEQQVGTIKDAASKLTGPKRRAFQAQVTLDDLEGRARRAERVFGWGRNTVELGLHELVTSLPTACSNGGMPTASVMPTFGNWSSTWTTARRTPASGRNS